MTPAAVRVKYLATINGRSLPENTPGDLAIRYLDIGAVGHGALVGEPDVTTFGEAPSRARRLVAEGDTIVSTVRTYLRAVWPVRGDTRDLVVSTGFVVLSPGPLLDSAYLGWVVQSDLVIEEVVARSVGVSYPGINGPEIGDIRIPVPPLLEQRAIAHYLETETARIDALTTRYVQLLRLLADQREAVTLAGVAGVPAAGSRRPSTLPWLTRIPAHWREAKLTLLARLGSGHTPSREHPEWWVDCTIPWITTGEVGQIRDDRIEYLSETREKISELGIANSSAELHPAGTVVLSRTASAGFSAIMATDMATSQDYVTWTCGPRLRPRFLLLCLRAMRRDLLERLAMGSTHQTIYIPDIQSIRVPLPPLEEQDWIVDQVWERLRDIDAAADAIKRQVDLLAERRQALITAAVSGQCEIPSVAA